MHNGCNIDSVNSNGFRRDNVNLVMAGYLSPPPILSANEFSDVGDRIRFDEERRTHSHNLVRAEKILTVADKYVVDKGILPSQVSTIQPYLKMLRLIAERRPYIDRGDFRSDTKIPSDSFLSFANRHFTFEASPACENSLSCFVGQSEGRARIEFVTTSEYLVYATLFLPAVERGDSNDPTKILSSEIILRDILGLPGVITDRNFEFADPDDVKEEAFGELANCGFHWSIYFFLEGFYEVSTWKGGRALQVRIFPSGFDVFHRSAVR